MQMTITPEEFKSTANILKTCGEDLKRFIDNTHSIIGDMHSVWTGKQYSELVKSFNKDCHIFGDVVTLTKEDVPAALIDIVNTYLATDGQLTYPVMNSGIVTYPEIATNEQEVISINTEEVEAKVASLKNAFKNAKAKIDEIETKINNLSWTGASAENFKFKIKKYKEEVFSCFDLIESKLTEWMTSAAEAMKAAEKRVDIG